MVVNFFDDRKMDGVLFELLPEASSAPYPYMAANNQYSTLNMVIKTITHLLSFSC